MSVPLSFALRESLRAGYTLEKFRADFLAGLIVSLVALPLAMALSIAVGLPPQHGLYTAIIAGIVAPLLGGSMMQVSGPTAAFVVIVAPIVAQQGLRGLIIAQAMAGVMLLLLAWGKLGRFINFVPYPVTTGFTAGIAVVLGTLSLNDLLGLGADIIHGGYVEKVISLMVHLPSLQWPEALVGGISLFVMFSGKIVTRRVPSTILGMAAGIATAAALRYYGIETASIGSRFHYENADGIIGYGIPPWPPVLHWFGEKGLFALPSHEEISLLLMPAVVIAALAALESLLSAAVADGMSRTRHEPNAELAGIGVANVLSALAAGIPATGAIARTTTNIKSGARTPIASSMHGLFILLFVCFLTPWISYLPMAALAALLFLTAYNMSHYRQFLRIFRIAPRHEIIVLVTCFGLTVFVDMVAGVSVGIMLAALLFIQRLAEVTEVRAEEAETTDINAAIPRNVLIYHIHGPLFFASVERALDRTAFLRRTIDTLILDMEHVPLIDMTGLVAMKALLTSDSLRGKQVLVCAAEGISLKLRQKLDDTSGLQIYFVPSVDTALAMLRA